MIYPDTTFLLALHVPRLNSLKLPLNFTNQNRNKPGSGRHGTELRCLIRFDNLPVIVTLHCGFPEPTPKQSFSK